MAINVRESKIIDYYTSETLTEVEGVVLPVTPILYGVPQATFAVRGSSLAVTPGMSVFGVGVVQIYQVADIALSVVSDLLVPSLTMEIAGCKLTVTPGLTAKVIVGVSPTVLSVWPGMSVAAISLVTGHIVNGAILSVCPGLSASLQVAVASPKFVVTTGLSVSGVSGTEQINGAILSVNAGLSVAGAAFVVTPSPFTVTLGINAGIQIEVVPAAFRVTPEISLSGTVVQVPQAVFPVASELSVGEVQRFKDEHYRITYLCVVTGDEDGMTDLVVPISSFQGRFRSGDPSFLSAVAPGLDYAEAINARANGDLIVYMVKTYANGYVHTAQLMAVDLENIDLDEGSTSQSITLSGHRAEAQSPKAYTLRGPSYHSIRNGKTRYRCVPDLYVRPGDTVTVNGETFVAGLITWTVGAGIESMEVSEA